MSFRTFAKLKVEQIEANAIVKKTQDMQECVDKLQNITNNYEKLSKEKIYYEEKYIKISGNYKFKYHIIIYRVTIVS